MGRRAVIAEWGHVACKMLDGTRIVWRPTLGRSADLASGDPMALPSLLAQVSGAVPSDYVEPRHTNGKSPRQLYPSYSHPSDDAARRVLAAYADPGCTSDKAYASRGMPSTCGLLWAPGRVALAKHLLTHAMMGALTSELESATGTTSEKNTAFMVAEHIAAASSGLEIPVSEVCEMTMTEVQQVIISRIPKAKRPMDDEEYSGVMALLRKVK